MHIRLLNHDDTKIFCVLRSEAVYESPSSFAESINEITEKPFSDFSYQLDSHGRGDFVLGAFDQANKLIGVVGFYRAAHAKKSHKGTLWGMYVIPECRQKGIGSALVSAAIERAKNLPNILHITLCVTAINDVAKRLYESMGFQIYGVEKNAIHIDGKFFDEVLMQL